MSAGVEAPLVRQFDLLATAPGGVARLRELILTLAVLGKLVPQEAGDEPASVLLQRIRAEKDRLIAAGEIKRDKPLASIGDEPPFALPPNWEWTRLGTVTKKITDGTHHSPANFPSGDFKYLSAKNIKSWGIDLSDVTYVPAAVHEEIYSRCNPERGDILYIKDGATTGVLTINTLSEPFSLLSSVGVLKPSCGLTSEYLALVMRSPFFYQAVRDGMTGVAITRVTLSKLSVALLPLPPLAEQSRIVTRVEELMRLCDALEQQRQLETAQHAQLLNTLLGTLTDCASPDELAANWQRVSDHFDLLLDRPEAVDALEQTILQLAVRGLLVPQDPADEPASVLLKSIDREKDEQVSAGTIKRDKTPPNIINSEIPHKLPNGWEWVRLGRLANFIDYRGKTPTKTGSGVPLITAKNVRQGFINREPREFIAESAHAGWMTRGFPRIGDILFTTEAPLGNVAPIDIHERFALAQRVICFGLYETKTSEMLTIILRSSWMQKILAEQASGVTAQGIKSARLQLILIPLPPLAEQTRIVARVTQLRDLCTTLRQRLAARQTTQRHLAEALAEV